MGTTGWKEAKETEIKVEIVCDNKFLVTFLKAVLLPSDYVFPINSLHGRRRGYENSETTI